jgi:hypothetical protein
MDKRFENTPARVVIQQLDEKIERYEKALKEISEWNEMNANLGCSMRFRKVAKEALENSQT